MPIRKLTPAFVRHVRCPADARKVDYFDADARGFVLEVRASGGKTYYQRYTDVKGRERQFKIGPADTLTLHEAKRKAKKIKADAITGGDPQGRREAARLVPTLLKFVQDQYLPYVRSYKRSWKTDETMLRIHILPKLGRFYLDEITPNAISALKVAMRDAGYAPGTIGRAVVILRYVFNLARKWKATPSGDNPASEVPIPPDVQRNRFLSKEEISRLVEALRSDENQVAAQSILLLLLTGARRNEVTHLRWQHVDLQGGTFLVPLSKSGKPRYVVLNREACALLRSLPRSANNEYVFPSPVTGRPSASLHFPWTRIRERSGLTDVRLHDLRHSFASVLVNKKVNLYDVQRLLGHANAKATQRYSHLSQETLTKAADVMGDLLKPLMRKDTSSESDDDAS